MRIPPVLEPIELGSREKGRTLLAAGTEFVFLFIFDFHSHIERKNPIGLVTACWRVTRQTRLDCRLCGRGAAP